MNLLKKILVAVDFDETLDAILAAAGTLARTLGSEIVLLHVVEAADESGQAPEALQISIAAHLEQIQQSLNAGGVNVAQASCMRGKASAEIVVTAERMGASLIVLGSRGTGTEHLFSLGTTTENVIRWSPKPVLAVPPKPPLTFAGIVCPVDFSEVSARGLANAIHLARAFRSKLHILTVVSPPSRYHELGQHGAEWSATMEQAAAARCQHAFDEFLSRFDFQGVTWEKQVLGGDPARAIVQIATSTHADLIVMGSTGRTGLPYMLMGSTAIKVVRQLPCALLTVKRAQVLVADVTKQIDDLNAAFEEGQLLLAQGFYPEAITRLNQCLDMDSSCADAVDAKAEALDRLGQRDQAEECRKLAETMRQKLWEQRVTASVRAEHPLLRRLRPYQYQP